MDTKTYFEEIGYDYDNDRETVIIVDENGIEADYNGFKDGDVLILLEMPCDLWDESTWSFIHPTGRAIWSSTRYVYGGWEKEYEN